MINRRGKGKGEEGINKTEEGKWESETKKIEFWTWKHIYKEFFHKINGSADPSIFS